MATGAGGNGRRPPPAADVDAADARRRHTDAAATRAATAPTSSSVSMKHANNAHSRNHQKGKAIVADDDSDIAVTCTGAAHVKRRHRRYRRNRRQQCDAALRNFAITYRRSTANDKDRRGLATATRHNGNAQCSADSCCESGGGGDGGGGRCVAAAAHSPQRERERPNANEACAKVHSCAQNIFFQNTLRAAQWAICSAWTLTPPTTPRTVRRALRARAGAHYATACDWRACHVSSDCGRCWRDDFAARGVLPPAAAALRGVVMW